MPQTLGRLRRIQLRNTFGRGVASYSPDVYRTPGRSYVTARLGVMIYGSYYQGISGETYRPRTVGVTVNYAF